MRRGRSSRCICPYRFDLRYIAFYYNQHYHRFQDPLSKTSMFVLYKGASPLLSFLMSILFNRIAIRFFNHLMSHTEYVLL